MKMIDHDASAPIDDVLLRGLEPVLSPQEQTRLTALMTSGDPNELAVAAKVLHDVESLLKDGIFVHQRSDYHEEILSNSFRSQMQPQPAFQRNRVAFNNREQRVAQEKKENDLEKKHRSQALPLPVRMPRYVVIDAFDPEEGSIIERSKVGKTLLLGQKKTKSLKPSLAFVSDEWDGTLEYAFTKLQIIRRRTKLGFQFSKQLGDDVIENDYTVKKDFNPSPGFNEIVTGIEGGYKAILLGDPKQGITGSTVSEPRVLLAHTRNDAAKLGLQSGDVITHINGTEVTGMTAEAMKSMIQSYYSENKDRDAKLELVVNAEPCIAQALRLRSLV